MWEVQLHCDWYAGNVISREEPHWGIGPCLQLYPEFSYRIQPLLPHVWEATAPSCGCHFRISPSLNYGIYHLMQKMQEHVKWVHKKSETFQAKKAQCHKQNYDKRSKATALEVGDMVLVHETAFKGHHKIQDQWENRESVVEKQPYPNVPVYVVCPRNREGHSQTLHGNYLLPISSNLEQNEKDTPMAGVEHTNTSAPAPSVDSAPADIEPSGMVTSNTAGNTSKGSPDQPVPLRCGTCLRYQNFGLLADTSLPGIWDAWVCMCICLHFISCLYTIFVGSMV